MSSSDMIEEHWWHPTTGSRGRYRPDEGWRFYSNDAFAGAEVFLCPWQSGVPYPPPAGWELLTRYPNDIATT